MLLSVSKRHATKWNRTCLSPQRNWFSSTTSPPTATGSLPSSSTATSTSTTPVVLRPVLSRRVWQAHAQTLPKKPKVTKVQPDDKPWPRNVLIGAGVAACIAVPYTALWLITSNPTLRETLGPYLPLEQLRSHFGTLEWDCQSSSDQGTNIPQECYQYPLEYPFRVRKQQKTIEETEKETITANFYILGDGTQIVQESKQVPASAKANPQTLAKLVGTTPDAQRKVAVVFEDSAVQDVESNSPLVSFDEDDDDDEVKAAEQQDKVPTKGLLKEIHTFSTWYYNPMVEPTEQQGNRASDTDIERLRLEYTVEKLEKDLWDPTCTRDHDEMRAELKQAKRDLSRLRWKRRLGL